MSSLDTLKKIFTFYDRFEVPQYLHHYSSLEGMCGILKCGNIWATDTRFLNDSSELKHLPQLILERLYFLAMEGETASLRNVSRRLHSKFVAEWEYGPYSLSSRIYVASFSEHGDQLSQWRGYCPSTGGTSLSFHGKSLLERSSNEGYLAKVIYNSKEQQEMAASIIDKSLLLPESIPALRTIAEDEEQRFQFASIMMSSLCGLASPVFKAPAFEEEAEWRLVLERLEIRDVDTTEDALPLQFRSTASLQIPYVKLPLPRQNNNLDVTSITIGPAPDNRLASLSVKEFIRFGAHCAPRDTPIKPSGIPYRPT